MKKSTVLNLAAVIALLSTGIVKADVFSDCINQAASASALVHARDAGTPKENIRNYVDNHYESRFHPMLYRIIDTTYDNPSLGRNAAYSGELSYCLAHSPKEKVADK